MITLVTIITESMRLELRPVRMDLNVGITIRLNLESFKEPTSGTVSEFRSRLYMTNITSTDLLLSVAAGNIP